MSGCALAAIWARIVVVQGLSEISNKHSLGQDVDFAVLIADFSVAVVADSTSQLAARVKFVAHELQQFIVDDLIRTIATSKAAAFAG